MFALVVFILTFITTMSHLIGQSVDQTTANVSGGYRVVVDSSASNPVPLRAIRGRKGVWAVAPLYPTTASFRTAGSTEVDLLEADGLHGRLARRAAAAPRGPRRLRDRPRGVARRPPRPEARSIVDPTFLQTAAGRPATRSRSATGSTSPTRSAAAAAPSRSRAIATPAELIQNGVFYGLPGARAVFGDRLVLDAQLRRAAVGGVDADAVRGVGCRARSRRAAPRRSSIRALMDESFATTNRVFLLFEGYLAMGLIVGIAGLAVVMVRAVRERRREIGTLRALGFQSRAVGAAFAIESGFIALEGTLLGVTLALVTLYTIVDEERRDGRLRAASRCRSGRWRCCSWAPSLASLLATSGRRARRAGSGLRSRCAATG